MPEAAKLNAQTCGTHQGAALLAVRVQPNAKKTGIDSDASGRIRVRVSEPPIDSKANRAVTKALSKWFNIPKSAIRLARGDKCRDKVFAFDGLTEAELRERLASALD